MVTKRFYLLMAFILLLYVLVLCYIRVTNKSKSQQNIIAIVNKQPDIQEKEENSVAENISNRHDAPMDSDKSVAQEAPVVNDTPTINTTPAANDTPTIDTTPVAIETPTIDTTPVANETPAIDTTPIASDAPVVEETDSKAPVNTLNINSNFHTPITNVEKSAVAEDKLITTPILKNELGFDVEQAYISDLKTYWHFRSFYYNYVFNEGKIGARINHSSKFGSTGDQYQIAGYTKLTNKVYGALSISGAKKAQIQYPNFQYLAEAYYNTDQNLELYLGQEGRIYSMFSNQKIYTYSAYVGKYFENYFAFAKINNYSVQGELLYLFGIRRYFVDKYSFISLNINFGKTPDIGDLPPLDQLFITKQKGIEIDGQFPIINQLYLSLALSYTRQVYPSVIRRDLDGRLGLMIRF